MRDVDFLGLLARRGFSLGLAVYFSTLLLCMPATAAATCGKKLVWAVNSYVPYMVNGPDNTWSGLDIDLIGAILDRAGCEYELIEMPGKRALQEVRKGAVDIMGAASITAERKEFSHFSAPYRSERITVFVRKDDAAARVLASLAEALDKHITLAAGLGAHYGAEYGSFSQQLVAAGLLQLNDSLERRMNMLARGRVQGVIEDEVAGAGTIRDLGLGDQFETAPITLNDEPVHILLSKQTIDANTLDLINAAIAQLNQEGTLQEILQRYRLGAH
mgnify:CR=1 FL=1